MKDEVKDRIIALVEKPLRDEGAELAEVILARYKNRATLRIFVYEQGGPSIEECARLSRIVGALIDGTDLLDSGYTLEVSSPGLDRPLRTSMDFRYRIGETVRIEFLDPERKQQEGKILSATDDTVQFENESGVFALGLSEIQQARIAF